MNGQGAALIAAQEKKLAALVRWARLTHLWASRRGSELRAGNPRARTSPCSLGRGQPCFACLTGRAAGLSARVTLTCRRRGRSLFDFCFRSSYRDGYVLPIQELVLRWR